MNCFCSTSDCLWHDNANRGLAWTGTGPLTQDKHSRDISFLNQYALERWEVINIIVLEYNSLKGSEIWIILIPDWYQYIFDIWLCKCPSEVSVIHQERYACQSHYYIYTEYVMFLSTHMCIYSGVLSNLNMMSWNVEAVRSHWTFLER